LILDIIVKESSCSLDFQKSLLFNQCLDELKNQSQIFLNRNISKLFLPKSENLLIQEKKYNLIQAAY